MSRSDVAAMLAALYLAVMLVIVVSAGSAPCP
jgi:hypothetical protein